MIIQKMNNVLVKHGKVTFAIFTGVVIVSFVWFFTPGVDGSLLFGNNAGMNSKYGSVLGRDVTIADVSDARQAVCTFCAAMYARSPQSVQSPDDDYSFLFAALVKAADALNIQASDKEVNDVIQTLPGFRKDGKFSRELYNKYKDAYLAPAGLGFSNLENAVRTMIRMKKVPGSTPYLQNYLIRYLRSFEFLEFYSVYFNGIPEMLTANVILSDGEAEIGVESLLQKITYHLISFEEESFEDQVKLEEAEIRDFYAANPSLFMSEPESDGLLAYIPYTVKKAEVSEEQMKDYYELRKAVYLNEDGSEQTFDEAKDAIRKELETTVDREEAAAKATAFNKAFRAALKADKEEGNPEDPQKHFREEAEKAGLKISEVKNITAQTAPNEELHIDSQLVNAVTILKNVGSYTNLQTGEHGMSMFLMTARRPSVVQPFEDVKEIAQKRLTAQRERALADEAASQLSLKFMELKDAPAEIEGLVKSLKGTWHVEEKRTRFEIESMQSPCMNEILTTDVGKLSSPDKQFGFPMFVFVNAHTSATAEEIAEQKEMLERELKSLKQGVVSGGLSSWILGSAAKRSSGRDQE